MAAPKDPRQWIRVSNTLPDHAKVEQLTDNAFRALISLWCHCSRQHNDGVVTASYWKKNVAPSARKQLLTSGLAEVQPDGSIYMHDYEKHQLTRQEMREADGIEAAARTRGGLMTAHKRWHSALGKVVEDCIYCASNGVAPVAELSDKGLLSGSSQLVAPGRSEEKRKEEKTNTPSSAAPTERESEPKPTLPKHLQAAFDAFWTAYPRKVGKLDAQRKFAVAVKHTSAQTIVTGAVRYAAANRNAEERFIAHPSTWLQQGRWDDQAAAAGEQLRVNTGPVRDW